MPTLRRRLAGILAVMLAACSGLSGCGEVAHPNLTPGQHRGGPIAKPPQVIPYSGPVTLVVISSATAAGWNNLPGIQVTFRAIQGLVNRSNPRIFMVSPGGDTHDNDWLAQLLQQTGGSAIIRPDANNRIDDPTWYLNKYRDSFSGYLLFDSGSLQSSSVAISLASALNAIPIDQGDRTMLHAAQQNGLAQLADTRSKDSNWLKSSSYWSKFSRDAIFFSLGGYYGADYAIAMHMAAFADDVRNDPQMNTMATMLSDQNPGGIMFGWGYTDAQHGEDIFVAQASRYDLSVMDLPANISVFMHFRPSGDYQQEPAPTIPADLHHHYVAFVFSDGDNPAVVMDKLTLPGSDRYSSSLRGSVPMGWTIPPTMSGYAAPILTWMYSHATANDEFIAGPSGYGYAFPSFLPDKDVFASQTSNQMGPLNLHSAVVFDENGTVGFNHASLDPITAQPSINGLFFTAFDGLNQPPPSSILWSNGKPVFPVYVVYRPAGQVNLDVVTPTAAFLNGLSTNATTSSAYTLVYLDFWSISMTDVAKLISKLNPGVEVVRPDVLVALATHNIAH